MKWILILLKLMLLMTALSGVQACAADKQEINTLIKTIYHENVFELLCVKPDGALDEKLIVIPMRYFSIDFMKYYGANCKSGLGYWDALFDPRTGQIGLFSAFNAITQKYDIEKSFTNLNISQPKINANHASIRTTYDLPNALYQEYGNFSLFSLIKENGQWKIDDIELGGHDQDRFNERESMTGLVAYKSLKQSIKKNIAENVAARKKAAAKKQTK